MAISQFEARMHLDRGRILLLDLEYAGVGQELTLAQLDLAEKHCRAASSLDDADSSPAKVLWAEIDLRRKRLQQ